MGLGRDAAEAVRKRQAEDAAAATVLGANTLWLDYPDAMYRGTPAYHQADDALFGTVNAGDTSLDEELAGVFLNIAERAPLAAIYAPLGIGHHVDHQLCCSAADRLAQRKLNVKFYEDFPYVALAGGGPETRQRGAGHTDGAGAGGGVGDAAGEDRGDPAVHQPGAGAVRDGGAAARAAERV